MQIKYGFQHITIDITEICLNKLVTNNIIRIPDTDQSRAEIFSDPIYNVLKKIYIIIDDITTDYDEKLIIRINILDNSILALNVNDKLLNLQSVLKINHGNFNEEIPEQKMAVRYLTGNEKVLEIGGNIGRNTLIIASILGNSNNLVTLESDENIAKQLLENKELNNLDFHIESSALSKRKLIQKGWDTLPLDNNSGILEGYKLVNTITLEELYSKYNIIFDTLVLDCEGAFYYILMDMPEILESINLIIMENDYCELFKKQYVDEILIKNNFYVDYVESGGWGHCYNNFFEVWKRKI
jgi:FkbM family methyltransferase